MTVDKILLDDDAITKIAAKILDKISGKQGVVCQGYYCDNENEPDSSKQWNDVLAQNKLKLAETTLARVASMPLTQDEIEQVAIELKTKKHTTDTISEEEADTAVRKVLADNVLISRAVQKKPLCSPSGLKQCSWSSNFMYCVPSGPNNHCTLSGPNNHCTLSGPNKLCALSGPNNLCSACGPQLVRLHNLQCDHNLPFDPGFERGDILRLSEQVAQLAIEIKKLQAGK